MSQHQLLEYRGKYRILPEFDMITHDIPRDSTGGIAKGYDDIYISCQYGNKIYAYGQDKNNQDVLIAYIPSIGRGKNIIKYMQEHKIPFFNYIQTDIEIEFRFYAVDIDIVAKLLKAKTFGASINPFSSKNLPKSKEIVLPSDELIHYKEIISCVPQSDTLILHKITLSFLESTVQSKLHETNINFNYKEDMKKCLMSRQTKEYIYHKGFWNEYIIYLQNEINKFNKRKDNLY